MDLITQNTTRCRICLMNESKLLSLAGTMIIEDDICLISELLVMCANVMLAENDNKPQSICTICARKLQNAYEFKLLCERSDEILNTEMEVFEKPIKLEELNEKICIIPNEEIEENHFNDIKQTDIEFKVIYGELNDNDGQNDCDTKLNQIFNDTQDDCCTELNDNDCNTEINQIIDVNELEKKSNEEIKKRNYPKESLEDRTCDICNKVYKWRCTMLLHKKKFHSLNDNLAKFCKYCDYIPTSSVDRYQHLDREHSDKKEFECKVCNKPFFDKKKLQTHMIVHSGIKKHVCDICGVSFALRGNLVSHRNLHFGLKKFKCPECGKKFATTTGLKIHRTSHLDERPFVCHFCGAAFKFAVTLNRHVNYTHLKIRTHKCNYCDKMFTTLADCKKHQVVHGTTKEFKCGVCDKDFKRKSTLRTHMLIHTGDKKHVCEYCGKGFIQKHVLKTHVLTHQKQ